MRALSKNGKHADKLTSLRGVRNGTVTTEIQTVRGRMCQIGNLFMQAARLENNAQLY